MKKEKLNVEFILDELRKDRPIFHSEGDFQFSLANKIKEINPELNVRLEYPMKSGFLDIFLFSSEKAILFELKYKTTELVYQTQNNEMFNLKILRRKDLGFYGFIKDIARLEEFKIDIQRKFEIVECYALILTNEKCYWLQEEAKGAYKDFLTFDGNFLKGDFNWGRNFTNTNSYKRKSIQLKNTYKCSWKDYSKIPIKEKNNQFRYLLINVI